MGGACRKNGSDENCISIFVGNAERTRQVERTTYSESVIIKSRLKYDVRVWIGFS
jgi:hypothetical protein